MYPIAKRILDLLFTVLALPFLAIALPSIALGVYLTMGRPILFRQARIGQGDRPFELWKFRSMRSGPGTDADRLTAFGRFLRATSLDELPGLLNVAKGEMSLVGPRPLLPEYLPRYSSRQRRRHEVPPGITGWAQVHGRNRTSWEHRLELDVWYVEHRGLLLDLRIILKTFATVLSRRGVAAEGHVTMPPFTGNGTEDASGRSPKEPPIATDAGGAA